MNGEDLQRICQQAVRQAQRAADESDGYDTQCIRFFDALELAAVSAWPAWRGLVFTYIRDRAYIPRFGFPVLSAADIRAIAAATGGGPMVEVGAGPGYLAWECNRFGLEVHPTEPFPEEGWTHPKGVHQCDGRQALRLHPEKDLLYSWPAYREPHTADIIWRFRGRHLVYIGEPAGCANANDEFFDLLDRRFEPTALLEIRTFPYIHDSVHVYQNKAAPASRRR